METTTNYTARRRQAYPALFTPSRRREDHEFPLHNKAALDDAAARSSKGDDPGDARMQARSALYHGSLATEVWGATENCILSVMSGPRHISRSRSCCDWLATRALEEHNSIGRADAEVVVLSLWMRSEFRVKLHSSLPLPISAIQFRQSPTCHALIIIIIHPSIS